MTTITKTSIVNKYNTFFSTNKTYDKLSKEEIQLIAQILDAENTGGSSGGGTIDGSIKIIDSENDELKITSNGKLDINSITSIPLASNAATESTLNTLNNKFVTGNVIGNIGNTEFNINNFPSNQTISGNVSISDFVTPTNKLTINSNGQIGISNFPATQPVSIASLPVLPTGTNTIGSIANTTFASTQSGVWSFRNQDGSGNNLTSQASGSQRALDIGINVSGNQIDPRQIRALTSSDLISTVQSGIWNINSISTLPSLSSGTNTIGSLQNISGTISLPTGAATSAKQPTLGTAGSPSTDVISIQGITNGTSINTYNTGQSISGTTISVAFSSSTTSATFTLAQKFVLAIIPAISGTPTLTLQITLDSGTTWVDTSVSIVTSASVLTVIECDSFARLVALIGISNAFRFKSSSSISSTITIRYTYC